MSKMTVDELRDALPPALRSKASQELADRVNQYAGDPEFAKTLKDNLIGYTRVLLEGKFAVEDYISAVTYVSLKLMGFNNQESYARTFPKRYQTLRARGADDKEISAYVAAYNKNKLVNLVLEQSLVPTWVLNQDVYQRAINTQADLMINAKSEKVRSDAANSILTHLKRPEKQQVELNIGVSENSGMTELKDMLASLAQQQQDLIAAGAKTQVIAHQKLRKTEEIEGSCKDITPQKA
jgi:hypothetical protein